jgi:hypothetical protein
MAILVPIGIVIAQLCIQAARSNEGLVSASRSQRTLINARELVGAWKYEQVNEDRITKIPFEMDALNGTAQEWLVQVTELTIPVSSKQVSMSLLSTNKATGLTSETGPITFWVTP